jgi:hypothetical protein
MRFSAIIDDPKSFEDLQQAAACAAAFLGNDELTLKIFPDGIAFVCATGFHDGFFVEIKLLEHEIFSAFKMEGVSTEKPVIIMQVQRTHLVQIFQKEADQVKIKLVKRNNQPTLTAEFKSTGVLKTIPVKMVKSVFLDDYMSPVINQPIVGLIIKQMDAFHTMHRTFELFKAETNQMRLSGDGCLFLKGRNEDNVEICAIFDELESVDDVETHGDTDYFRVKVNVLNHYFGCLPDGANRCEIRVTDIQIVINVKYSNANYILYMMALRNEAFGENE